MRVSKADAEKNRARLIAAAGKQLREQGIEGVGVDALAKAADLSHGSVYSHFKSKDDLTAAAVAARRPTLSVRPSLRTTPVSLVMPLMKEILNSSVV